MCVMGKMGFLGDAGQIITVDQQIKEDGHSRKCLGDVELDVETFDFSGIMNKNAKTVLESDGEGTAGGLLRKLFRGAAKCIQGAKPAKSKKNPEEENKCFAL